MTDAIVSSVADGLLTYGLHSSLLLGGVWFVQRCGRLCTDSHREMAWKLALPGAVLSATLQLAVVGEPLGGTWDAQSAMNRLAPTPAGKTRETLSPNMPDPVHKNPVPDSSANSGAGADDAGAVALTSAGRTWQFPAMNWPLLIVSLWLSGVLLTGSRQVYMRLLLERELRGRRPITAGRVIRVLERLCEGQDQAPPRISVAPGLPSPIVLARGEICVPMRACTDLHEPQLEAMLAHELAHLQRRDPWWLWLCALVEVAFFFQPLNRVARREIVDAAEFLTDYRAVGMTADSRALAECLAEVAGWLQRPLQPSAIGMAASALPERVRRLAANKLQGEGPMTRKLLIPLVLIVTMAAAGLLPGVDLFRMDAEAASTSRHVLIDEDEHGRVQMSVSTNDENLRMELDARGKIEFAPDDSDITSMTDGDFFDLGVSRDGDEHRVRIEGENGRLVRSWWVNGDKQSWNAEAAAWFADVLPEVFRRTGINVEQRVAHMLDTVGVDAVLDEIELIQGDYSRRMYFTSLMDMTDPSSSQMSRAIRLAGSKIDSDFELRTTLTGMVDEPGLDESSWAAFFVAARTMGSDFEQRTVLAELAERVRFDKTLIGEYLETSRDIGSDFEMRQALSALLARAELDEQSLGMLLRTSVEIASDFEQASLLIEAAAQVRGQAFDDYLEASGKISSDFEQRRALDALVQSRELSRDEAIRFLDASTQISSDFELASLLLAALSALPDDPAVRAHYRDIARSKLGSDFERNRVLAALAD